MAKTPRRDPVADVLGDESPIMAKLAMQATAPRNTPQPKTTEEDNSVAVAEPEKTSPRPARRAPAPKAAEPKPKPTRQAKRPAPRPTSNSTKAKRCLVSPEEEMSMDDLAMQIGRKVGTKTQFSQVTRAMWSLLQEAEEVIDRVSAPSLTRPSNGKPEELAEFEADLADYLLDLFQAMKAKPRH